MSKNWLKVSEKISNEKMILSSTIFVYNWKWMLWYYYGMFSFFN